MTWSTFFYRLFLVIVSATVTGGIAFCTGLLTATQQQGAITKGQWTVTIVGGILAALKDVQSFLASSPQVTTTVIVPPNHTPREGL